MCKQIYFQPNRILLSSCPLKIHHPTFQALFCIFKEENKPLTENLPTATAFKDKLLVEKPPVAFLSWLRTSGPPSSSIVDEARRLETWRRRGRKRGAKRLPSPKGLQPFWIFSASALETKPTSELDHNHNNRAFVCIKREVRNR